MLNSAGKIFFKFVIVLFTISCVSRNNEAFAVKHIECRPNSESNAVKSIEAKGMADWIYELADDSMRGRNTPSPEIDKVADLIANNFQSMGLEPGTPDKGYIQHYPLPNGLNAPNVIGILRGRDPKLKNEYVVFSAHMDHVGIGPAINGDSIYNGADDNASGTSAVIEIAKAMSSAKSKPLRSMVFLLLSGEEKGLLGSEWFVNHPAVPLDSIVADLNIDMIGRNQTDQIVVIGKQFSSLGATVEMIACENPNLGLKVIDDPWPDEMLFYRSDHYNFAINGIPILFFTNGVHEDYHRPSDEAVKINFEKTARVARLIALTGLNIANSKDRPKWDKKAFDKIVGK